jgi:hypothetical protein
MHVPVLEAYRVTFDNPHYKTNYGYRKVVDIQREVEVLKSLENSNLMKVFAVKLDEGFHTPRLTILLERRSGASLKDVLLHSDGLKVDRALVSPHFLNLTSLYPPPRLSQLLMLFAPYRTT